MVCNKSLVTDGVTSGHYSAAVAAPELANEALSAARAASIFFSAALAAAVDRLKSATIKK